MSMITGFGEHDDLADFPEVEEEEILHSICDDNYEYSDNDTARNCMVWEEDMAMNGE